MNSNHFQAMLDGMSAQWQRERAESQMTLGKMVEALEAVPSDAKVGISAKALSYRGYYCDLSFEPGESTAGELLDACRKALLSAFEGYKGGEYVMNARAPVWVAHYGCCGERLLGISPDGAVSTGPDDTL